MSEQAKTLLLMAAVLAAVCIYAVIPQQIAVGEFLLKKMSITALKSNTKENANKIEQNKTITKTQRKKTNKIKHHTFLFIGDSMVEGLSRRFGDYAAENEHKLYTVIWYSSTTEKWAKTQTIEHFIKEYKPTYIILCLGSNELFINDLDIRQTYIEEITKKLHNYPYVWISPSVWNGETGIIDLIQKHVPKGSFYDSRPLKLERGADHYHPTWEASAEWMNKVADFMKSNKATYPLRLKTPKAHHKATNTKLLQPAFEGYKK